MDPQGPADYTIRIGAGLVELADDRILSTTTYNGKFPGPLLRLKEGRPVTVDIYNDTDTPEKSPFTTLRPLTGIYEVATGHFGGLL